MRDLINAYRRHKVVAVIHLCWAMALAFWFYKLWTWRS